MIQVYELEAKGKIHPTMCLMPTKFLMQHDNYETPMWT